MPFMLAKARNTSLVNLGAVVHHQHVREAGAGAEAHVLANDIRRSSHCLRREGRGDRARLARHEVHMAQKASRRTSDAVFKLARPKCPPSGWSRHLGPQTPARRDSQPVSLALRLASGSTVQQAAPHRGHPTGQSP